MVRILTHLILEKEGDMSTKFYEVLERFLSDIGAEEVSAHIGRMRRGFTGSAAPIQPHQSAQRGDVDDAYFDLKKPGGAPPAKQQAVWAWIQDHKKTREGRAALHRLEQDKNTDRIKSMFEQGTADEWNASIPRSTRQRIEEFLPTLDRETQEQLNKTLGGATRMQERWLDKQKPRARIKRALWILGVLGACLLLMLLLDAPQSLFRQRGMP